MKLLALQLANRYILFNKKTSIGEENYISHNSVLDYKEINDIDTAYKYIE